MALLASTVGRRLYGVSVPWDLVWWEWITTAAVASWGAEDDLGGWPGWGGAVPPARFNRKAPSWLVGGRGAETGTAVVDLAACSRYDDRPGMRLEPVRVRWAGARV